MDGYANRKRIKKTRKNRKKCCYNQPKSLEKTKKGLVAWFFVYYVN